MATTRLPIHRPETTCRSYRLERVPMPAEAPEIARQARAFWGLPLRERLDLDQLCGHLGIKVATADLAVPRGGAQGFLIPRGDSFLIEVDPEPRGGWPSVREPLRRQLWRHRWRFLVAHELAHTLFYAPRAEGPPRRIIPDSDRQEAFCDELARSLLVPTEVATSLPFRPESAIELQRRFDVSMEVALRSLVASRGETGAAWLLLRRQNEMKIQWSSASRRLTTQVLRGLRDLAANAYLERSAEARLRASSERALAVYLPERQQVVVTLGLHA
jgi:IrrE N-terminal-like domain